MAKYTHETGPPVANVVLTRTVEIMLHSNNDLLDAANGNDLGAGADINF